MQKKSILQFLKNQSCNFSRSSRKLFDSTYYAVEIDLHTTKRSERRACALLNISSLASLFKKKQSIDIIIKTKKIIET